MRKIPSFETSRQSLFNLDLNYFVGKFTILHLRSPKLLWWFKVRTFMIGDPPFSDFNSKTAIFKVSTSKGPGIVRSLSASHQTYMQQLKVTKGKITFNLIEVSYIYKKPLKYTADRTSVSTILFYKPTLSDKFY